MSTPTILNCAGKSSFCEGSEKDYRLGRPAVGIAYMQERGGLDQPSSQYHQ
jgi:hypothetical protein